MLNGRRQNLAARWAWEALKLVVASLATTLLASQIMLARLDERIEELKRNASRFDVEVKELRADIREIRGIVFNHQEREAK